MLPINWNPAARELRSFARLWLPLFVAFLGVVLWWRFGAPRAAIGVWAVGAVVSLVALVSTAVARAVFVGLMVFTPLGWAMRLAGRDPLRLRARGEPTGWQPYRHDDDPERVFRQF
jgi:hypothetical protein